MATITPQTTYTDGALLDIANHNANVYSVTPGRGVMSEPNGGLEQANLITGFTVRAEHIMSEEAVSARADSLTMPMDIYSNGFGMANDVEANYVAVAGLCQRTYIPFNISALVWEWSFFIAAFRPAIGIENITVRPNLDMRVFIDGVEYPSMRRPVPISADILAGTATLFDFEQIAANWYDFALLQENVSQGYHELAVKLFMERPTDPSTDETPTVDVSGALFGPDQAGTDVECKIYTRISYGTRSARAIMFK
jgi:hypothetical protein